MSEFIRYTEVLPVTLTDTEIAERDRGVREAEAAKMRARTAKAESARLSTAEIKSLEARIKELTDEAESRTTLKHVEVEERPDHEHGVMRVVRLDTEQEIRRRKLSDEERQQSIKMPPAPVVPARGGR